MFVRKIQAEQFPVCLAQAVHLSGGRAKETHDSYVLLRATLKQHLRQPLPVAGGQLIPRPVLVLARYFFEGLHRAFGRLAGTDLAEQQSPDFRPTPGFCKMGFWMGKKFTPHPPPQIFHRRATP